MERPSGPPGRLDRRLGLGDAVGVGLGAMLGAGVFAAAGPAAAAAGPSLLLALVVAGAVAALNAASTAALAARMPEAGGAYVYGRARLGAGWGHLAGWGFVAGKTASCAAMALTVGAYTGGGRVVAAAAVVGLTAVSLRGVDRTARLTRGLVAATLLVLAAVVGACLAGGTADAGRLAPGDAGTRDVLAAAALLFFAFAGYARVATLGEEVRDPARTIPRAVAVALGVALTVYALVLASALAAAGAPALAAAEAPLVAAVRAGDLDGVAPLVRVGATAAALGVLLSLLAGVSRTALAMARTGDLPRPLAAVHPVHRVPHRAELAVAVVVLLVVLAADVREAIGFSSVCVLTYYAVAHAAAWTLPGPGRARRRVVAAAGLAGCAALALSLDAGTVATGAGVLLAGAAVRRARRPRTA